MVDPNWSFRITCSLQCKEAQITCFNRHAALNATGPAAMNFLHDTPCPVDRRRVVAVGRAYRQRKLSAADCKRNGADRTRYQGESGETAIGLPGCAFKPEQDQKDFPGVPITTDLRALRLVANTSSPMGDRRQRRGSSGPEKVLRSKARR
jgi:hypothetical protein